MGELTYDQVIEGLHRYCESGVIGFYDVFEVTEIFGFHNERAYNIVTVIVGHEKIAGISHQTEGAVTNLTDKLFKLKNLNNWSFGINRYHVSLDQIIDQVTALETGGWSLSGKSLITSQLIPITPQFVPADSVSEVPVNAILKNNFGAGSYVFEFNDALKENTALLHADLQYLEELSEKIRQYIPLDISSLTDRLGNILIQLPVSVISYKFSRIRVSRKGYQLKLHWHPKGEPRSLKLIWSSENDDGVIVGCKVRKITQAITVFDDQSSEPSKLSIFDEKNDLLLSGTGQLIFLSSLETNLYVHHDDPRTFTIPKKEGEKSICTMSVREAVHADGRTNEVQAVDWRVQRSNSSRRNLRVRTKEFIQYGSNGKEATTHKKAVQDIRSLIADYGVNGAWLWDPYLQAADILNTLFFSPFGNTDLRALTRGKHFENHTTKQEWCQSQSEILEANKGNQALLKLEFRISQNIRGGDFHDRFLIFPNTRGGTLAWSLGTSVNSLGKQHHILHRVSEAELIADAFEVLWDQLDKPAHLVWKSS